MIYPPASEKPAMEQKEIPDQIVSGSGTILLMDDEEMIREVGGDMLRDLGYQVLLAASGEEGLRIYESESNPIDLVILDLVMPGAGGGETFDRLRQMDSQSKVLLSSGYSLNGQATAILDRGCNGFIQKPFDLKQLSRKIKEVLES